MVKEKNIEFELDKTFDPVRCRHYLNGVCTVLHCHHYATLYTQLADDAVDFNGKELLKKAAEDSFYAVLNDYYSQNGIEAIEAKISIAQQYWQVVGMGMIKFTGVGQYTVTAEMDYSHLDEGWLKKWGSRTKPVNFISAGFVGAVAALTNNKPLGSYKVKETKGLVCGDDVSAFEAILS
ncbi:MAG: hypothetical protein KJ737_00580 [Proteobacteria bacterium]|nr:hypothetical protein [Pseudomonadota bacterium]